MPLVTAYLLRGPATPELRSGMTRHVQSLRCAFCREAYTVDYESSCTDSSDLAKVLQVAQMVIDKEHFSGHRDAKVEVANTIHPSAERARQLIEEFWGAVAAGPKIVSA